MNGTTYSIKNLEVLTGIKAHTIRIWEQRYNLLEPKRTETNIRYYDAEDLKKILNVSLLYNHGTKISKIAKLSEEEILENSKQIILNKYDDSDNSMEHLINATIAMDHQKIDEILNSTYNEKGMIRFYQELISPYLIRIGELWQLNAMSVAHEHFFSNILKGFVNTKISGLTPKRNKGKKVILFLHEDEEHEMSLLFYHYLLKDMGWECYYLGCNTPIPDFETAFAQTNPQMVITSFIKSIESKKFKSILNKITDIVPEEKLCLSGYSADVHTEFIPKKVNFIKKFNDFSELFG